VLVAARDAKVRRVVFAGSSSVYGETPTLPKTESTPPAPISPVEALLRERPAPSRGGDGLIFPARARGLP
jgi:hypothetical protein